MTTVIAGAGRGSFRRNNFDLIRVAAASQVLIFHGLEHLGPAGATHLLVGKCLSWFPGVPIFFAVSGFLVSLSFERSPTVREYLRNRSLRIFPALWVCLVFALLIAVVAGMPFDVTPNTPRLLAWWAAQMSVLQFYNPEFLRGFGVGVLNGSLWTIPVELQFYLALPLLYAAIRHIPRPLVAWVALTAVALFANVVIAAWAQADPRTLSVRLTYVSLAPYLYMFMIGLLLQRNYLSLQRWLDGKGLHWLAIYVAACLVGEFLGWNVGNNDANPLLAILLAITTISLAFTARGASEKLLGGRDLSYGTYIYHMPVINCLLQREFDHSYMLVTLTAIITYALAWCSWHFVEAPFLRRKHAALRPTPAAVH